MESIKKVEDHLTTMGRKNYIGKIIEGLVTIATFLLILFVIYLVLKQINIL